MSLKYGSLFSGYAGLDLGLQSVLGGETAWFCEFDKAPSKILAHHWPDVPNLGDVTKVDWTQVEPVDVITGGSPCQDLSHAGRRAGMTDGTRSNLWVQMREAIHAIRPRLVVWENVRGALSANAASDLEPCPGCMGGADDGGPSLRALGRVLGDLSELGYDARWYGLRAADVGGAHGRFRVFLYATPADTGGISGWRDGGDAQGTQASKHGAARTNLHQSGPARGGDGGEGLTLLPTPAVNDMGAAYTPDEWDEWTDRMKAAHGNGNGHGKSLNIEAQRLLPTPSVADGMGGHLTRSGARSDELLLPGVAKDLAGRLLPTPRAVDASGIRGVTPNRSDEANARAGTTLTDRVHAQDWREYEAAIRRAEHALGRPAPAPTETGPKGKPRLSPAFVEFLMMLPAGHVTNVPDISRNDQLKALGNGVVPAQCAAATRAFLADITKEMAE